MTKKSSKILLLMALMVMVLNSCNGNSEDKRPENLTGKTAMWYDKAQAGDVEAQYKLAQCYFNGTYNIKKDEEQAFSWAKKSADQQYPAATFLLGEFYDRGIVVEQDQAKAKEYYDLSYKQALPLAEKGDTAAQTTVGIYFGVIKNDSKKAVEWYKKAADQDCAYAQCVLGVCYKIGDGVKKDFKKAYNLFKKSAEHGEPGGQFNFGECYYDGCGVKKDYKTAVIWFRKAAEQGSAMAQNNLGYCYQHGHGIEQNLEQAIFWYTKAAENDLDDAQNTLGYCYEKGIGVAIDYNKAVYWYQKALDQGNVQACLNLGYCYANGIGVEINKQAAIELYQAAAREGSKEAQRVLRKNGLSW